MNLQGANFYKFGDFKFDLTRRRLERISGEVLRLPPKAIDILRILLENGGEIVEKDFLMEKVWADIIVEESNLTQTIYLLRKALGENAAGQNYIKTIPKRGYCFAGSFTNSYNDDTDQKQVKKIAVLAFENHSGDAELEYMADGLSENLIDTLSQFPQIHVIARSSSFRYKNSHFDSQEIAEILGVKIILEGRVTQRGEKTMIRAELIDVEQGIQLWGKTIECRVCDIQEIRSEIANNVLEKLELGLTQAQKNRIIKPSTFNDEAYQLYLSGLFLYRKGGLKNTLKTLEFYDRATDLDPDFAFAFALKPAIYAYLAEGFMDKKEAFEKASIAAEKALQKGAELPQTHIAAAIIKKWELDMTGALREYQRTFELTANNSSAHNNYALILSSLGQHHKALEEIQRAIYLDPLLPHLEINKAWVLINAGKSDEALDILQKLIEIHPELKMAHGFIATAYEEKDQFRKAIAANRKILGVKELAVYAQSDIIYNLFKLGETEEASEMFEKLQSENRIIPPTKLAAIFEIFGNRRAALETLENAYENRDPELHALYTDFRYKSLHKEPRFQKLLKKIGLIG